MAGPAGAARGVRARAPRHVRRRRRLRLWLRWQRRRLRPWLRRLRPWLRRLLLALLLGPLVVLAVYRFVPPPATPLMLVRLAQGYGLDKDWVSLDQIAPALRRAVIAAEDNLFCAHDGFDWKALRQEIGAALNGERPRGASTISMQTVKNALLWPGRDPVRKVIESWLTPQLELLWGKRRILEVYLNVVELGPGIYGAEAAARHWFRKPAAKLSSDEAARLAAILPSPLRWSPLSSGYVARRARVIRTRVGQLGPLLDCAG
jgi:monofunctional biosynthetic peptidoglycan transglycosylase